MEYIPLDLEIRNTVGGNLNRARHSGYIPGIVYGNGMDPTPVQIKGSVFARNLRQHGINTVYNVNLNDQNVQAVIRDLQVDPLKKEYLHVDLQQVSMNQEREAKVPIRIVGKSKPETRGGVFNQQMEHVTIRALPADIPAYIEINVSDMKTGDLFKVRDLHAPDNLKVMENPDDLIVSLSPVRNVTDDLNKNDKTPANAVPITGNDERETKAT
jgi:large subunit ribosomal protein L25